MEEKKTKIERKILLKIRMLFGKERPQRISAILIRCVYFVLIVTFQTLPAIYICLVQNCPFYILNALNTFTMTMCVIVGLLTH